MKKLTAIFSITILLISTNSYSTEITPLLGFRGGGEFVDTDTGKKHTVEGAESYGFILSFPYEYGKNIEIFYSHQSSELSAVNVNLPATTGDVNIDLTIDYLHIGGTTPIAEYNDLKTFVSGGIGFTYLSPDLTGLQSDLRASFSIGIGLKWPVTEKVSLRLETRGLATLFNSNTALFCNGGCALTTNGSLFIQAEVLAGLTIRF